MYQPLRGRALLLADHLSIRRHSMRRVLAEDQNNDLYLADNNQLAVNHDINTLVQLTKSAVEVQKGELIYDVERGVPMENAVWRGNPDLQQLEFYIRKQIRGVEGVTGILSYEAEVSGEVIEYRVTITTIYGEVEISGFL